jgi:hypothetical protein
MIWWQSVCGVINRRLKKRNLHSAAIVGRSLLKQVYRAEMIVISALRNLLRSLSRFKLRHVNSEGEFRPYPGMESGIGQNVYTFQPHPHPRFSGEVQKVPRERTTIYQLQNVRDKKLCALKVMHQSYRKRRIKKTTNMLRRYMHMSGLFVARRTCLTKQQYPELIAEYPELEYAVLMPWLTGQTWAGLMDNPAASANYTRAYAIQLALKTADILWNLEKRSLAHTDIAGDNVVLLDCNKVELIDIESLYSERTGWLGEFDAWRNRLRAFIESHRSRFRSTLPSGGTPGYQHPHLDHRGQRRLEGDRFAGAILLTEMLTWWNPLVRAQTDDRYDSLFQSYEMESPATWERRLQVIRKTLRDIHPGLCDLFDQAWNSSDLAECPEFAKWKECLCQAQPKAHTQTQVQEKS